MKRRWAGAHRSPLPGGERSPSRQNAGEAGEGAWRLSGEGDPPSPGASRRLGSDPGSSPGQALSPPGRGERRLFSALLLLLALLAAPAFAVPPDEVLADPALEARAGALAAELRCMVCQNQSIDDSDAPLAHDLRVLLRERIAAGDSDRQVIDFLVARYGEFILLKPRFAWHTALLWTVPPAALVIGGIVAVVVLRNRRGRAAEAAALSGEEEARLKELLSDKS